MEWMTGSPLEGPPLEGPECEGEFENFGLAIDRCDALLWLLTRVGASENDVYDRGISGPVLALGEPTESMADCRPSIADTRPLSADCRPSAISGDLALPILEAVGDCGRLPRPRMLGFLVICFFGGGGNNCNPIFTDIVKRVVASNQYTRYFQRMRTKRPTPTRCVLQGQ